MLSSSHILSREWGSVQHSCHQLMYLIVPGEIAVSLPCAEDFQHKDSIWMQVIVAETLL